MSRRGTVLVVSIALVMLAVHLFTNHRYGFHRDELQLLDDARDLQWGYVVYPPLAPAVARLSLELFGVSLAGFRLFAAVAQSVIIVLAGLMARELGGGAAAQAVAAAMAAIGPVAIIQGAMLQYVGLDYLWWVLMAWLVMRLIRSDDPRWWLAIGAVIGAGVMTRYTIVFFVAGLVAGVVLTPLRRHLRSRWLWLGVAVSLVVALPNIVWQVRNDFITVEFLRSINARDVRIGRTSGFLLEQLFVPASTLTIPWWLAGLWFYFVSRGGRPYRVLGWMFAVPLMLFLLMNGRAYYLAPAYPMLLAAGAVVWERHLVARAPRRAIAAAAIAIFAGAVFGGAVMLPLAPPGSPLWKFSSKVHDNFVEQIGWPELVSSVAAVHAALPAEEKARAAIFASNYGEAGAINLYGPAHGLPRAISGVNSHWKRGYGSPPPETLIILGARKEEAEQFLRSCEVAGVVTNFYGVENEEYGGSILVCREPLVPWEALWPKARSFG